MNYKNVIKIVAYCTMEVIFFPTIMLLLLCIGFMLTNYNIFLGFEKFFAVPVSWIAFAASVHLGTTLGGKIVQKKISVSDKQKLENMQKIVSIIIYIFCMFIALLKLSN
jgi:hypothetical protein